jgi:hypothetical protein
MDGPGTNGKVTNEPQRLMLHLIAFPDQERSHILDFLRLGAENKTRSVSRYAEECGSNHPVIAQSLNVRLVWRFEKKQPAPMAMKLMTMTQPHPVGDLDGRT